MKFDAILSNGFQDGEKKNVWDPPKNSNLRFYYTKGWVDGILTRYWDNFELIVWN